MTCTWEVALAQASSVDQVRVTVSSAGHAPCTTTSEKRTSAAPVQASLAVMSGAPGNCPHSTVTEAGGVTDHTGGWVSRTMMVWVCVMALPPSSVAVQVLRIC